MLTFVILAGFAGMVGVLTDRQIRSQFNNSVRYSADRLYNEVNGKLSFVGGDLACGAIPGLREYGEGVHAQIRILASDGRPLCRKPPITSPSKHGPQMPDLPVSGVRVYQGEGYLAVARPLTVRNHARVVLVYAEPLSDTQHTEARVQFVLLLGVLGGSVLALLAGLATAQRAIRHLVRLTEAAREVERTRDPSHRIPHPEADDEVAELARTLEDMLGALDDARRQSEEMLVRQREFVADASHELRTPLTSVLANLELLAEELDGEQADSAQSALRATRRMRRLVGDLLLLARADAKRVPTQRPTDLAQIVTEAASELGPLAEDHELSISVEPAVVPGVRDDLYRLVLNLIENAVQHTPPGTCISAVTRSDGALATLVVEDDGPGIDPALERRVFERFVRGAGDGGRGSGLGLAIVQAVASSHGGSVTLTRPEGGSGTRFVVQVPQQPAIGALPERAHTSTTTGSTIGRRRSRS